MPRACPDCMLQQVATGAAAGPARHREYLKEAALSAAGKSPLERGAWKVLSGKFLEQDASVRAPN